VDVALNPMERWEADIRRYLSKCPQEKALDTIRGLRAVWRRPTAQDGMYQEDRARFSPVCQPGGEWYEQALDRLEKEFADGTY
jgi:hypothetical protein